MADAPFDDHRPMERFSVEGEEHVVIGHDLPERMENGCFLTVVTGEQQLDTGNTSCLAQHADEEKCRAGQAAGFQVERDRAIG